MAKRADNIIEWIQEFCTFEDGSRFILAPWQKKFIRAMYPGRPKAVRKVRRGVLSTARKNGKSSLMAALALVHLVGPEARPGTSIRTVATTLRQAGFVYKHMARMVERDPDLSQLIELKDSTMSMMCPDNMVGYETIASRATSAHGDNIAFWIYDELAQSRGLDTYEAIDRSGGAVPGGSMGIITSTNSKDPGNPLADIISMVEQGHDTGGMKHWHKAIYAADDEDDDIYSLDTVKKANPNLGVSLSLEEVMGEIEEAQLSPTKRAEYRAYRLNQTAGPQARLCDPLVWRQAALKGPVTQEQMLADLRGEVCNVGLDLSDTKDLTSLGMHFPAAQFLASDNWLPADTLMDRAREDRVPYAEWHKEGHLRTIPGPVIRHEVIYRRIIEVSRQYELRSLRYDRYRFAPIKRDLERDGLAAELVEFGQGYQSMSPAVEKFEQLLLAGELHHANNWVLNMAMYRCRVKINPTSIQDERKPAKAAEHHRIDPAVAAIMAVADLGEKGPVHASWLFSQDLVGKDLADFAQGENGDENTDSPNAQ